VYGRLHRRLLDKRRPQRARAGGTSACGACLIGEDARAASNDLTALLQIGFARVASQCDVLDLEPPRCARPSARAALPRSALTGCVVERNPAPQGPAAPHEKHILKRPMRRRRSEHAAGACLPQSVLPLHPAKVAVHLRAAALSAPHAIRGRQARAYV
jgi:hypothetical protein